MGDDEFGVRLRVDPVVADIDIVFVHGLAGHALKTWQAKDDRGRTRNWILDPDFLPSQIPNARVFTFGYNANVFSDVVTSRVIDHANGLLGGLQTYRVDCEDRPILWVGHSLGGIVIKKALVSRANVYHPMVAATKSIVFLGTPHSGSFVAGKSMLTSAQKLVAWAMARHDVGRLVEELQPFSETLRDTSDDFKNIADGFQMVSFVEQKTTRLPPPEFDQLIVPQGSAVMYHGQEQPMPLSRTHEMLCKFNDPRDSAYDTVIRQVNYLANRAIVKHQRGIGPALPPRSFSNPPRAQTMSSDQNVHHFYHFEQSHSRQNTLHNMSSDEDSLYRPNPGNLIEYSPPPTFLPLMGHRHNSAPMTRNASQEHERASAPVHMQSPADIQNPFSNLNLGEHLPASMSTSQFKSRPQQKLPQSSVFGEDSDVESADEDGEEVIEEENTPFSRLSMFDTVFVLDDTRSMTLGATTDREYPTRWKLLGRSMESVVDIACEHDRDGVDVHFLKNTMVLQKIKNGKEIMEKLGEIKKTFKQAVTAGPTIMHTVLERVIEPSLRAYRLFRQAQNQGDASVPEPKPLNLIFVTDGAAIDKEEVEGYIKRVAQELDALHAPPSFVGIQFVQIGDDGDAAKFLKDMDDQLENRYQIRDMVDTVRWDDNRPLNDQELLDKFVQVLLGAVTRLIDKANDRHQSIQGN